MLLTLTVGAIEAQKDEYARITRDVQEDEWDFWNAFDRKAIVKNFKRFKVTCALNGLPGEATVTLLVSMRGSTNGGFVTILVPESSAYSAFDVFNLIEGSMRSWPHRHKDGIAFIRNVTPDTKAARLLCTIIDPMWFAEALHHIREAPTKSITWETNDARTFKER